MRRGRNDYSPETALSFYVPDPAADDDLDTERQARERGALVANLRSRIGELEQRHHLPADDHEQSRSDSAIA